MWTPYFSWCIKIGISRIQNNSNVCIRKQCHYSQTKFVAKLIRKVINTCYNPLVLCKIVMKANICPCAIAKTCFEIESPSNNKATSFDGTSSIKMTNNESCKNITKRNKTLKCLD